MFLTRALTTGSRQHTAPPSGLKKWHPGHYVYASGFNNPWVGIETRMRTLVKDNPLIAGYKTLYNWNVLEPTYNNYDFGLIHSDIIKAKADGKKLIIKVLDRSFQSISPYPDYILTEPQYEGGGFINERGHSYPKVWVRPYMERLTALFAALGDEFDSDPTVSLITLPETASVITLSDWPDYYINNVIDNYYYFFDALLQHFPNTPYVQYTNFLAGANQVIRASYLDDIIKKYNSGFGNPEIWRSSGGGETGDEPSWVETTLFGFGYEAYKGDALVVLSAQFATFARPWTDPDDPDKEVIAATDVLEHAVDVSGAHIIVWTLPESHWWATQTYDYTHVLQAIENEGARINTARPTYGASVSLT